MIFTFYSFKGGVGRSMALANVGDVLARRGLRVLMIDMDLEAPGLESYFEIPQAQVRANPGVIDLLSAFKRNLSGAETAAAPEFQNLDKFIYPIYPTLPDNGGLFLMPAGRREPPAEMGHYALAVRTFDWQDFYFNWEGEAFFEWLRKSLIAGERPYDVVLIDSRTGVTEMGGICAYRLADVVLMMCAANQQNIKGTRNVADDFTSSQVMALRRGRPLQLVVVPARVEQRDPELLAGFFDDFDAVFSKEEPDAFRAIGLRFRDLAVPYEMHYAFKERVAAAPDARTARGPIEASFERMANALTVLAKEGRLASKKDLALAELAAPAAADIPSADALLGRSGALSSDRSAAPGNPAATASAPSEKELADIIGDAFRTGLERPVIVPPPIKFKLAYDPTTRFAGYDVFLSANTQDREAVGPLAQALRDRGFSVFHPETDVDADTGLSAAITQALQHSRFLMLAIGSSGLSELQTKEIAAARASPRNVAIVPVLLAGADAVVSRGLSGLADHLFDLRDWLDRPATFELLCESLRQPTPRSEAPEATPATPVASANPYPGLLPFREDDAPNFFARARETEEVLRLIETQPITVITGSSGIGKTSLVLAGVFPRLRKDPARWRLAHVDARGNAAGEMGPFLVAHTGYTQVLFVDHIDRRLGAFASAEDVAQDFASALTDAIRRARAEGSLLKLVLAWRAAPDEKVRKSYPEIFAALSDAPFTLELPDAAGRRALIEKPAERNGRALEPGLTDRMLNGAGDADGALSLLQLALTDLWQFEQRGWLTHSRYNDRGGIAGYLAIQAEAVFSGLEDKAVTSTAEAILLRLVTLDAAGSFRRKPGVWEEICTEPAIGPNGANALRRLASGRLVTLRRQNPRELLVTLNFGTLSVAWKRLDVLIEQARELLQWREVMATNHAEWIRTERKDFGALLSGAMLDQAQQMREKSPERLSAVEVEYIEASARYKAEREQAAKKKERWVSFALAALIFGAIGIYQWKTQRAEKTEEAAKTLATQQEQISGVVQQTQTALENKDYKKAEELVQQARKLAKPSYGAEQTKR
jgi:cellulose biosynthesis protein BcsQ